MYSPKTLSQVADEAALILEAEFEYGPEQFIRNSTHSDIYIINYLYLHCWCDYFSDALFRLTGWSIVGVHSKSGGSIHRLNITNDGKLVDVTGYVALDDLKVTYKCEDAYLKEDICRNKIVSNLSDAEISMVTEVFLHLKYKPFNMLNNKTKKWLERCMD